jgi:uncharacterized pyridoxamine 5'-phosphate oxidase family protein
MIIHVQFSDESETEIVSTFSCPQPETTPYQGVVEEDSELYREFLDGFI